MMFNGDFMGFTLWQWLTVRYGKSLCLMDKSTISMVIFHSYVKLPEGSHCSVENMGKCIFFWGGKSKWWFDIFEIKMMWGMWGDVLIQNHGILVGSWLGYMIYGCISKNCGRPKSSWFIKVNHHIPHHLVIVLGPQGPHVHHCSLRLREAQHACRLNDKNRGEDPPETGLFGWGIAKMDIITRLSGGRINQRNKHQRPIRKGVWVATQEGRQCWEWQTLVFLRTYVHYGG